MSISATHLKLKFFIKPWKPIDILRMCLVGNGNGAFKTKPKWSVHCKDDGFQLQLDVMVTEERKLFKKKAKYIEK